MLDIEPWLSPLEGSNPSGESLRDDPRFHEIEELMRAGSAVVRDGRGDALAGQTAAVDWARVLECAEALRARGRDLRLLVIVARALLNERGPAGLAEGLTLVTRTVETHWETLHPALRETASPRDAALRRINALLQLENGDDGVLGDLRRHVAFTARGLGAIHGRDLERGSIDTRTAQNEAAPGMSERERSELVAAHEQLVGRVRAACTALADEAPDELAALTAAMSDARAALDALEAAVTARTGDATLLPGLRKALGRMAATLERAAPSELPAETAGPWREADDVPAATDAGGPALPDRLSTRAEVVACLDRIIEFYDRTEPASPVPYLARRMRRMVPMDFLELMEDLAPSGLKEFRSLAGISDKASTRTQGDKT